MAYTKLGDKWNSDTQSTIVPSLKRRGDFVVGMTELQILCDALRQFPPQTPKRWELVAQLVSTGTAKFTSSGPQLHLHRGAVWFTPVHHHCRTLSLLLHEHYPALLKYNNTLVTEPLFAHPQRDAFKPLVLIYTTCWKLLWIASCGQKQTVISTRLHYTGDACCCLLFFTMQIRNLRKKVLPQSLWITHWQS